MLHTEVSREAPGASPAVLHNPVVLSVPGRRLSLNLEDSAGSSAIADSEDTVVELGGRAEARPVDSSIVELERNVRSIHSNRDGSNLGDGGLEVGF